MEADIVEATGMAKSFVRRHYWGVVSRPGDTPYPKVPWNMVRKFGGWEERNKGRGARLCRLVGKPPASASQKLLS